MLGILIARNYRAIRIDRRACLVNGGGVLLTVAVVFAITAFFYFRTWEVIGLGRQPAKMGFEGDIDSKVTVHWGSATALTPNGEIFRWGKWYGREGGGPAVQHRRGPFENGTRAFRGSDWVDMAANRYCVLALRRDGSLFGGAGMSEGIWG